MRNDLTFALRLFRRQPGLFSMAIGGLALAIGLSTTIFSIVNATAVRGDGVRDPETAFRVALKSGVFVPYTGNTPTHGNWAYSDYLKLRDHMSSLPLSARAAEAREFRMEAGASAPVFGRAVSGNYFSVMGSTAVLGRTLVPADDTPGAPAAAVLSYAFWKNHLGGDEAIVGKTVWLDEQPYVVAGVIARGFTGPSDGGRSTPPAFWVTLANQGDGWASRQAAQLEARRAKLSEITQKPVLDSTEQATITTLGAEVARPVGRWNPVVDVVGRRGSDLTTDRLQSELSAWAANQETMRAAASPARRPVVAVEPVNPLDLEGLAVVSIVLALVALVVLLAAANVTNVLLASAAGRAREIGTRLALGASRGRVIRQLLTESLLLGIVGGALGFLVAMWLTPAFAAFVLVPPSVDVAPDFIVMGFVIAMVVLVGLAAGLAPARYVRRGDLLSALKTDRVGAPGAMRPGRLRAVLVGVQAAASVVLLVLAALLTRSTVRATTADVGFRPDRLVSVTVGFPRSYDAPRTAAYWDAAIARVREIPGIDGAALASGAPFEGSVSSRPDRTYLHRVLTSADYVEAIGSRILRGRAYTREEVKTGAPVAIISASLARTYWGLEDPIGASLERVWGPDDPADAPPKGLLQQPAGTRVVGVAADVIATFGNAEALAIYLPMKPTSVGGARLIVRTRDDPKLTARVVHDALRTLDLDPGMAIRTRSIADYQNDAFATPRIMTLVAGIVGIAALTLAVIGLFGVTAFVVSQRQHEVGVRMTLGATGAQILSLLMRDGLRPVVVGVGSGLVVALILGRLLQRVLFGVSGHDPLAIGGAVAVLLLAASVAVVLPARRAAGVDPARILRQP